MTKQTYKRLSPHIEYSVKLLNLIDRLDLIPGGEDGMLVLTVRLRIIRYWNEHHEKRKR
jgi:hypothetical protein